MSAGYPSSSKDETKQDMHQLAVPSSSKEESKQNAQQLAVHEGPPSHVSTTFPTSRHQSQCLGFETISSFARRTKHFYESLESIAQYLPPEGASSKEAMAIVTAQRQWMFDVGCLVGSVVGDFYQLEKNTLSELEVMWRTGQQRLSVKMMKKNFSATSKNLQKLATYREKAGKLIEKCEGQANQMVQWRGSEEQVQKAVMEVIAKFGGSAECKAIINDLDRLNKELAAAQEDEKKAAMLLFQQQGEKQEAQCKSIVFEGIASNAKSSMEACQKRAEELDKESAKLAKEACDTFNTYKRSWFFGLKYDENNDGDVAKWRADRFKEVAREAKEQESDQEERSKKAASEAAKLKGQLTKLDAEIIELQKDLDEKVKKTEETKAQLNGVKKNAQELRESFGNIDLHHVASLRDHMQKIPALLGAQGMQDSAMFSCMSGALLQHERLCDRIQEFLSEVDDEECVRMLETLTPMISQAISDALFFSSNMAPLQNDIEKCINALPQPEQQSTETPQIMAAPVGSVPPSGDGQLKTVSMADDDDDGLW